MGQVEITIQRHTEDGWPVVLDVRLPDRLPQRSQGFLSFSSETWRAELIALGHAPQAYGEILGRAIFREQLRDLFLQACFTMGDVPLQVLLVVEAPDLQTVYWERLCAPDGSGWRLLALSQMTPLTRYLPTLTDRHFAPFGRQDLRALIVLSNPQEEDDGPAPFDEVATLEGLRAALGKIPFDVLGTVDNALGLPTLDALANQLTAERYTLLHVVAHGALSKRGAALMLLDDDSRITAVPAANLLQRLGYVRQLPHHVFLSTCESGIRHDESPFGSLAQQMVSGLGIPAVVAMSDVVSVKTATALAEAYYRQLAEHGYVDLALTEARAALAERLDIVVPTLFSRLYDRPLFSDTLDRPLTLTEWHHGLDRLTALVSERAPILKETFDRQRITLQAVIGADPDTLSEPASNAREEAVRQVEELAQTVAEISFAALAIGKTPVDYGAAPPFPGLEAFAVDDARFFFGRDALVEQLMQRLAKHPFLAILGASGSGKSSVTQAGLLAKLYDREPDLIAAVIRPGSNPENVLSNLPAECSLLIVDQFEEVFTLCHDDAQRRTFFQQLLDLSENIRIVVTMRADFYGDLGAYGELKREVQTHHHLLEPLTPAELRNAIEQQAAVVGLRFEAGLAQRIFDDVAGEPGAMPLLQHALRQLWTRRHGRWLRTDEYEAIGGVRRAIAETAQRILDDVESEKQRRLIQHIFLRLTRLGEEKESGQNRRDTRRRRTLDELVPAGESREVVRMLVNRLADHKLLVTTGDDRVEVAHEALIQHWPQLQAWLEQSPHVLRIQEELGYEAERWGSAADGEKEEHIVLQGKRLEQLKALIDTEQIILSEREIAYVSASVDKRSMEARRRERRTRQLRVFVGLLTIAFITTGLLAVLFYNARQNALEASAQSRARELAATALLRGNSAERLAMAIQAMQESSQTGQQFVPEAVNVLFRVLVEYRGIVSLESETSVYSAEFSPDGTRILTRSRDEAPRLWSAEGELLSSLDGHAYRMNSVVFSLGGRRILTAGCDEYAEGKCTKGTARLLDSDGILLIAFEGHTEEVNSAVFSPDGRHILTASEDSTARLWDLDGTLVRVFEDHTQGVNSAVFSSDGTQILTASDDGMIRLWDINGALLTAVEGYAGPVFSATFSHFGARIVTTGYDAGRDTVRLWQADGHLITTLEGYSGRITSIVFSPTSEHFMTTSRDSVALLWDANGELLATLEGHTGWLNMARFSPNGKHILTASNDGTARLWDADGTFLIALDGHAGFVHAAEFSADGKRIVTASGDNKVRVWNTDGNLLASLEGHDAPVLSARFNPDGTRVLTASTDKTARLWDIDGPFFTNLETDVCNNMSSQSCAIERGIFSPDNMRILTVFEVASGAIQLWNADGRHLGSLESYSDELRSDMFSPDAKHIVTPGWESEALLWDRNGDLVRVFEANGSGFSSTAFSPDGTRILSTGIDGTARLWEADGDVAVVFEGHDYPLRSATFSPDGERILTFGLNEPARLWTADGDLIAALDGHDELIMSAIFSLDRERILTIGSDRAMLWDRDGAFIATVEDYPNASGAIYSAQFGPDGERILIAGSARTILRDSDGEFMYALEDHAIGLNPVAFSPEGERILTSRDDGTIRLWASNGEFLTTLEGHTERINAAVFTPNGERILTASQDGWVRVWDREGNFLFNLEQRSPAVTSIMFSPDGSRMFTITADGTGEVWDTSYLVSGEQLLQEAVRRLRRTVSYERCLELFSDATYGDGVCLKDPANE